MDSADLPHEQWLDSVGLGQRDDRGTAETRRSRVEAHPDERVGGVEPRGSHTERAELDRLHREARHERLHHRNAAADVPRHRPDVVEARREREDTVGRDEAVARLEPDDPAARRRNPDRAARIGAERRVRERRDECGRRAAARSAGGPAGRRRVRDRPVVEILRGDAVGELVQVRLANVCVAGLLEQPHGRSRLGRDVIGEHGRPIRRPHPGRVEQILHSEPDPTRGRLELRDEDAVQS